MDGLCLLRLSLAGIFSISTCWPIFAQRSWKAQHCHALATESDPRGPKVIVDDLVLDGTTDVAVAVWNRIASETKAETFVGDAWVDELREVSLRDGLQNQGYLKPEISTEAKVSSSSPALEHVVVHVRLRAGPRYTLSSIQFRSGDSERHLAFSAEELRTLVPLHEGDLFSAEKVREAMAALRKHYTSDGYIDFVATPETEIDEIHQQIALVMSLQEGPQYRFGNIEILGLDSTLETEFQSKFRPGDVLNFQLIYDFYREHKSELPEEVLPEDTDFHRNIKERTVDALFDFRSCSQLQN
jgi:hypothetical protein